MSEYGQSFDPIILIGHYDLISWFSDFASYLGTHMNILLSQYVVYDKTFDPQVIQVTMT